MRKQLHAALWIVLLVSVGLLIASCDLFGNLALVGTWMSSETDERWIFNNDGSFTEEVYDGSTWTVFMDGDYAYSNSNAELTLSTSTSDALVMDVILNEAADRMTIGLDALSGGDVGTLAGTWEGTLVGSDIFTRTWVFATTTLTHTTITGSEAIGDVVIDTTTKEFTVSTSDDTGVLPDGTYTYLVIGEGITIAEPGEELYYFDKE